MQFDLESFTYDEEWLRSVARIEADCDDISAGVTGVALGRLLENPAGYSRMVAAQMLVLRVWKNWVSEWSLGIGTKAAQLEGRQLLLERLKAVEPSVQERLLAIADEKQRQPQGDWQLTADNEQIIRQVIGKALTDDDWNAIASMACARIRTQVIRHPAEALSA